MINTKDRIIAKITAAILLIGTGAIIIHDSSVLTNGAKEIVVFISGAASSFLFQKE